MNSIVDEYVELTSELERYVREHGQLDAFLPAVQELCSNARRVRNGDLSIGPLKAPAPDTLPDRATADAIVAINSRHPPIPDDLDPALLRAIGQLSGNFVEAVVHAVFVSFPTAVPREAPDDPPTE